MSSPLRVKVEVQHDNQEISASLKLVHLVRSPVTTTIRKLIAILQAQLRDQFGLQNIRLMQLTTDDGYLLMNEDICNDVLINNEKLVCIDMERFVNETRGTINVDEAWFSLKHHDVADNTEKSLSVGMNSTGKLYIYLYGGRNHREIYLFSVPELLAIAQSNKKDAIHSMMKIFASDPFDWLVEAKWEQDSSASDALRLVGNLKTGDMTQVQTGTLQLVLNESTKSIERWEVTRTTKEAEDPNRIAEQEQARLNQLKDHIPPPKRTGPTIDTTANSDKLATFECEGDSALRLIQGADSSVEVLQEAFGHDGVFRNFVTITHMIISKKSVILPEILNHKRSVPVEKSIPVVRVSVEYQRHDGKWLDCQNAKIVVTSSQSNEKPKLATTILNVEPDKVVSVSFTAAIPVKGKPNRCNITRSRAHRSLPQPLKLKVILIDNLSKTCSLIMEQINEPLHLITKETILSEWKNEVKKLIAFVYADDCECDERIYAAVFIADDDTLRIRKEGRYSITERSQMRVSQWHAKRNKTTEELIEFISDSQLKAFWLFDPETYLLYAVRIELTTETSQTVETILLPLDEIK